MLACGLALAGSQPKGNDKKDPDKSKFDPDSVNNLEGRARWNWVIHNAKGKGKALDSGTFMGYRTGQIYHGKNQIGTYKKVGPKQVSVTFTAGPLQGTADLRMTNPMPVTFEGDLVQKTGRRKLVVEIRND